jgi:hypothetical protein
MSNNMNVYRRNTKVHASDIVGLSEVITSTSSLVNDVSVTATDTWSSQKIQSEITQAAQGMDVKESVRMSPTVSLSALSYGTSGVTYSSFNTLTQVNPTDGVMNLMDDIAVVVGDRLLLKKEVPASQNGIYSVVALGDGVTIPWVLTRSADADQNSEISGGMYTYVEVGTINGGSAFILSV